ncbi:MAG TPA: RcnB family protein [Caulobacteraceae bacterium]|nr:RcnB family protein [Caulobacteraceae bacterium]
MKRTLMAALAATLLASGVGAAAANAQPFPHGGGHGPAGYHGGPAFRPGPVVFRGGPARFGGPGFVTVGYHRWGYGEFLPRAWLVPARFVVDFGDYNLAAPPPNFEWVQNGPDALLVNLDTGMVVQVVPGAFA